MAFALSKVSNAPESGSMPQRALRRRGLRVSLRIPVFIPCFSRLHVEYYVQIPSLREGSERACCYNDKGSSVVTGICLAWVCRLLTLIVT